MKWAPRATMTGLHNRGFLMSKIHLGRAMVDEISEPHFRLPMLDGAVGRITSLDTAWIRGAIPWPSVGRVEQNARAF